MHSDRDRGAAAVAPASRPAATAATRPPPWPTLAAALVLLCGANLVASFLQSDPARNDFERFADLRLLFLFFALFAALCGIYLAAYFQRRPIARRIAAVTSAVCATLLFASFPVGSKDVFGYAFLGKMWGLYHANPYVVSPREFSADAWQPVLVNTLRRPLSVYGPLFMWQSWLVNAVAGQSLWLAVWLHKAWATLLLLAALWMAGLILQQTAAEATLPRWWLWLLLAWNPLFLFEAAGSAHNDVAMVTLLLAALYCWRAGRCHVGLGLVALSFWYKPYSIIFIPAFLIETTKRSGLSAMIRQAVVCVAVAAMLGAILLHPLPGAFSAIIGGLLHPEKMRGIFPNELSPVLAALFWGLRAAGLFETDLGFRIFDLTRFALFAVAVVAVLVRQWGAAPSFAALTESCFLTGLAFFLLLITQLWPWHLLCVIAFGVLCGREPFVLAAVVLTLLSLLSYFLTFAVATLMLGATVGAVWLLRRARVAGGARVS